MIQFDEALLNGAFNMIPNALFDLLLFSPSKIKIYHSDLQLKPGLRIEDYYGARSGLGEDEKFKEHSVKSFAIHDPFGQLLLLRRIVKNNRKVLADKMLENILNMNVMDYATILTKNYRKEHESKLSRKIDENKYKIEKFRALISELEKENIETVAALSENNLKPKGYYKRLLSYLKNILILPR